MTIVRSLAFLALAVTVAAGLSACRTSKDKIYDFDQAAHQRAVEIKSDVVALIANAGEPYGRHSANVQTVSAKVEEAYTLSAAAPDNERVANEWAAMKDPAGDLYGGFVQRWQRGPLDPATRDATTTRIVARLNYILCMEAAKRTKGGQCAPPGAAPAEATSAGATLPAPPPS